MIKNRRIQFYISIFLIFAILNFTVNFSIYSENRDKYFSDKLKQLSFQYHTITRELKDKGDIYFEEVVNIPRTLNIVNRIDDEANWGKLREELSTYLKESFERMSEKSIRQFHFHTRDNRSFLRMHKPDKFGDSLVGIRFSVEATNRSLQSHHGFEEGRIYNGFRNVYPVIYRGKHLGSVEVSFSFQAVSDSLQDTFGENYIFVISKNLVEKRVFDVNENYIKSSLSENFYSEKGFIKSKILKNREQFEISDKINHILSEDVQENLERGESFSRDVRINEKVFIVNFLSVKNIEGSGVAYIVNYSEDKYISREFNKFLIYTILGDFIAILLIYLLIAHIRKEELSFINEILDNQSNLIFVKRRDKIIKVNNRLLTFFGFSSLEELQNSKEIICNFFIEEEGFLSKKEWESSNLLVEQIVANPEKHFKVKIVDHSTKVVRTFSVNMAILKEQELYLIILSDITPNDFEKRFIEDKINRDKLTGAYNRKKFEIDLKDRILRHATFSLVLIDIDHFSKINESNGHMAGDKILMEFYKLIDTKIKKSDILYRWGGEEFIIIVDDKMLDATKLAEKLRFIIEKNRFFKEIPVNASFGVTEYRKLESFEEIMFRADKALYTAKLSGRNCVITC